MKFRYIFFQMGILEALQYAKTSLPFHQRSTHTIRGSAVYQTKIVKRSPFNFIDIQSE